MRRLRFLDLTNKPSLDVMSLSLITSRTFANSMVVHIFLQSVIMPSVQISQMNGRNSAQQRSARFSKILNSYYSPRKSSHWLKWATSCRRCLPLYLAHRKNYSSAGINAPVIIQNANTHADAQHIIPIFNHTRSANRAGTGYGGKLLILRSFADNLRPSASPACKYTSSHCTHRQRRFVTLLWNFLAGFGESWLPNYLFHLAVAVTLWEVNVPRSVMPPPLA